MCADIHRGKPYQLSLLIKKSLDDDVSIGTHSTIPILK